MAAPAAASDAFNWHADLGETIDDAPESLAVGLAAARRLAGMIRGIELWQAHPHRRQVEEPPVLWRQGSTRLLDYGQGRDVPPVLVIPSLINRAYILDLDKDCSFLRNLAEGGLRPVLLDWGSPGDAERMFDLNAYGMSRILPAAAILEALSGQQISLLGYCMGGTLTAGLAARHPGRFRSMVLIGAPWDFLGESTGLAAGLRLAFRASGPTSVEAMLNGLAQAFGVIPVDLFQFLFAAIDPTLASRKFRRFAALDMTSEIAKRFVLLEDWLADGVPMAGPAAIDLLVRWQLQNRPASGDWSFLGGPVRPGRIDCPSLVVAGSRDSIAPPATTLPLARAIRDARILTPKLGHVGSILSRAAREKTWTPVRDFLLRPR